MLSSIARGIAAGAAGITALNAASYIDMTLRGRSASDTPEQTVERLARTAHVTVPGDEQARRNRLTGLGALLGMITGTAVGAGYGALHGFGWRPPVAVGGLVATGAAMAATTGPLAALGVSDPRTWSATDWLSDVLPHLAFGMVTAATFDAMRPRRRARRRFPVALRC
ncbi:hypothetical protein ABZ863_21550 [Saccharomonospora sp. NPDC046836]|uniref:hypothetical protein n=1 Tax=Saccharomonospora sp. NPDC046836 TaxID=3156921 RepID=UPI0033F9441B